MSDLVERLRKRAKEDRQCADNNRAVVEALAEQMRLFNAREGHNVYAVRMAVDHKSGMERDNRYAADLEEAADRIEALEREVEELRAQVIEECARLIEESIIKDTNAGKVLAPRQDGNRDGLHYAAAIRAMSTPPRKPTEAEGRTTE